MLLPTLTAAKTFLAFTANIATQTAAQATNPKAYTEWQRWKKFDEILGARGLTRP